MEPPLPQVPPRLHVLLARDARVGVVIRKGPSERVCTLLWNRRTDEFTMGQWLKGQIRPRKCDLSPDGKHLIYWAKSASWRPDVSGPYTAVSRAPYLKALSLYALHSTYYGGGLFTRSGRYWLYSVGEVIRESREVTRDLTFNLHADANPIFWDWEGSYLFRLSRDGWTFIPPADPRAPFFGYRFEKPAPRGWTLGKVVRDLWKPRPGMTAISWDSHDLTRPGTTIPCPTWDWAEVDGNRLVWATDGRLYAGSMSRQEIVQTTELFDFNPMTFEPIQAPY